MVYYSPFVLSVMFSNFMSVGKLPDDWKHAVVTAIPKAARRAILPTTGHLTHKRHMQSNGKVIVYGMLDFLRTHSVINKQQYGFLLRSPLRLTYLKQSMIGL